MTLPLAKLKELAEKATPGPWKAIPTYDENKFLNVSVVSPRGDADLGTWMVCAAREANAAFIAAVNPQTVLALVERIEELEAIIKLGGYSTDDLRTVAFLGEGDDDV